MSDNPSYIRIIGLLDSGFGGFIFVDLDPTSEIYPARQDDKSDLFIAGPMTAYDVDAGDTYSGVMAFFTIMADGEARVWLINREAHRVAYIEEL